MSGKIKNKKSCKVGKNITKHYEIAQTLVFVRAHVSAYASTA